jgi:hypothetical protein
MALVECSECGREISDKAAACPGCGAPVVSTVTGQDAAMHVTAPSHVEYDAASDTFTGTMTLMVKLAMMAVQELGWKIDQVNENLGMVTFQTGISWGSWSGISCSLQVEEVSPNTFRVAGTGKQNIRGGQMIALNIGGEAKSKARKAIGKMKQLAV